MIKKLFAVLVLLLSWTAISWADSPLTSTDFARAYASSPMVKMAENVQGTLPSALLTFLGNDKAPVDERLAVVNQLGWDFEGTSFGDQLGDYLMRKHNVSDVTDLAGKLNAGTLAVYAYALAMSDYFNVYEAGYLAHLAVEKNEGRSFSVAMVAALIDAQELMDGDDWSKVYKVVADVLKDQTLRHDMKQEAVDIIMEYIDLYK